MWINALRIFNENNRPLCSHRLAKSLQGFRKSCQKLANDFLPLVTVSVLPELLHRLHQVRHLWVFGNARAEGGNAGVSVAFPFAARLRLVGIQPILQPLNDQRPLDDVDERPDLQAQVQSLGANLEPQQNREGRGPALAIGLRDVRDPQPVLEQKKAVRCCW